MQLRTLFFPVTIMQLTLRHSSGGWLHSSDTVTDGNSFVSFSMPQCLHNAMTLKKKTTYILVQ